MGGRDRGRMLGIDVCLMEGETWHRHVETHLDDLVEKMAEGYTGATKA